VALQRINTVDEFKMPPGGRQVVDQPGVELVRQWIQSLPGPPVLAPPVISGRAGTPSGTVVSVAHGDSKATLRYTLDGSAPGKNSDVYSGPVTITNSTTVRARAYREGFTRSITVNETFILKP
jgi:chitinase